jgi:SNF2 family DNA or RNA helicase
MEYEICMPSRCSARNSHHHKISASDLLQGGNPDSSAGNGKISDIIKLINDQIPQDEKVLVFVQFPKLLKKVQAALSSSNIRFCDLDSGFGSSKVLAEFKRGVDNSESARVMLLNIGDASASGR